MGNMKNLSNIMEGYSPYKELREQTKGLVKKWEQTGLLEGLNGESEVHGMSILLENQARQLIDESSKAGTTDNSEQWSGVALPLVRKVFGEIAAKDFVSVQPMNLPSGLVFYLEFKYGTAQAGHTKDTSVFGTTDLADTEAAGGLYGAGKFGYSVNDVTNDSGAHTPAATTSASLSDINFEPTLSASVAAGTLKKIKIAASELTNPDLEAARAFELSGSDITTTYPAYSKFDADGNWFGVVAGTSGVGATGVTLKYHKAPTDKTRGDFEDQAPFKGSGTNTGIDDGTDIDIPEIDIEMTSKAIVAKTRKLKAVWTPELAQDLNAYHSVDAEAELTSMLSEYISMEIDLEILDMLIQNAVTTEHWSARVGYEYNKDIKSQVHDNTGAVQTVTGGWQLESGDGAPLAYQKSSWYETLGVKIQKVSNKIHQKTMRGGANFLVCGPDVATVIESIPGFTADTDGDKAQFAMGVQKVGSYANRFQVYKNPYMKENVILMGYRGSNFLETGAVYAPYIPLIMTPLVYDPVNFTPRKGVMTRYAKKIVRPEFYGKIVVGDLNYV